MRRGVRALLTQAAAGLLAVTALDAQGTAATEEETQTVAVVRGLFDAMRSADSARVRAAFHPEFEWMVSSGERDGSSEVRFASVERFAGLVGRSAPGSLDERIGAPAVHIYGSLATVVTPYSLYLNGQLSHCGVNVFQLARTDDGWRIVGLADTRRREGCEEWLE